MKNSQNAEFKVNFMTKKPGFRIGKVDKDAEIVVDEKNGMLTFTN
jgi:hypothetical protein